jgi:acylphosphatase
MARFRFVVRGRVQGVAFRAHACREAEHLGLVGFVANREDGAVEGEAEGASEALDAFAQWLHRGPAWARVEHVERSPLAALGRETTFTIRR